MAAHNEQNSDSSETSVKCACRWNWAALSVFHVLLAAAVVLVISVDRAESSPLGGGGQDPAMNEALKYLQQLDKHYAQVAKPRYGKRSDPSDRVVSAEDSDNLKRISDEAAITKNNFFARFLFPLSPIQFQNKHSGLFQLHNGKIYAVDYRK